MLAVSLSKVLHKLKILGGGDLNRINQWGEAKDGGDTIFDSNLAGGKSWRKLCNGNSQLSIIHFPYKPDPNINGIYLCVFLLFLCVCMCVCVLCKVL